MSGDDDKTLDIAIGHLPDTPKPWEPGNSAVAAHRDGLSRPLTHIKVGDDLRVRTLEGELQYRVRELKIVTPEDLSVLEPTGTDLLTLITCFPFDYVGARTEALHRSRRTREAPVADEELQRALRQRRRVRRCGRPV